MAAGKWLQDHWPNENAKISLRGLNPEVANQTAATLDALAREYPEVARSLSWIGGVPSVIPDYVRMNYPGMPDNVIAYYYYGPGGDGIRLSLKWMNDDTQAASDYKSGWSSTPDAAGDIQHEFGHAWEDRLAAQVGQGTVDAKVNDYKLDYANRTGDVQAVRHDLSRYATQSDTEMVAEAFAEVEHAKQFGGTARPFATGLIDMLKGLQ